MQIIETLIALTILGFVLGYAAAAARENARHP